MAATSRGSFLASSLVTRQSSICASCSLMRPAFQSRAYSATTDAAAATAAEAHHLKPTEDDPTPPITASRKSEYRIRGGVILTRAPLITRPLTPFENAFFFYQKRLNERLVLPFRHTLFFKKDTSADIDWRIKFRERGKVAAKELGRYYGQGRNAWNDELLVGSTLSDEERLRQILLKDAESRVTEDGEEAQPDEVVPVEQPMPRLTEADKANDVRRLDRALDQTLYLIVQKENDTWQFPSGDIRTEENLHEAVSRVLESSAGVNMNTWIVGRAPVAHLIAQPEFGSDSAIKKRGEKVFFLKGRIMAGQADLKDNKMGYKDFNWLTREELKYKIGGPLYKAARNMMADR